MSYVLNSNDFKYTPPSTTTNKSDVSVSNEDPWSNPLDLVLDGDFDNNYSVSRKNLDLKLKTRETVSNEGFVLSVVLLYALLKIISKGIDVLGEVIKNKMLEDKKDDIAARESISSLASKKLSFLVTIKKKPFKNIANKRFQCPIGLKTDLATCGRMLVDIGPNFIELINRSVDDYSIIVSSIISNSPEAKAGKRVNSVSKEIAASTKDVSKSLSKVIDKNSSRDMLPINKLIGNAEILGSNIDLAKQANDIYTQENLSDLKKNLTELYDKLDVLIKLLNDNKVTEISKPVAEDLVDGLENLARSVSALSALYVVFRQYNSTVVKLSKLMAK